MFGRIQGYFSNLNKTVQYPHPTSHDHTRVSQKSRPSKLLSYHHCHVNETANFRFIHAMSYSTWHIISTSAHSPTFTYISPTPYTTILTSKTNQKKYLRNQKRPLSNNLPSPVKIDSPENEYSGSRFLTQCPCSSSSPSRFPRKVLNEGRKEANSL